MLDLPLGTSAQCGKRHRISACCTTRSTHRRKKAPKTPHVARPSRDTGNCGTTSQWERRNRPLLSAWGLRLTIVVAILAQAMHAPHKHESLRLNGYRSSWMCDMTSATQTFHATRAYVRAPTSATSNLWKQNSKRSTC